MASVADLRRRLTNARNVQQLTRAMKTVAAARLHRARAAAAAARPYDEGITALVVRLAATGVEHPLLARPTAVQTAGRRCLVVIAGDRGLAGGFNAAVVRAALGAARRPGGPAPVFIAAGRRAITALRRRGVELRAAFSGLGDPVAPEISRAAAARLIEGLAAGDFNTVDLVYNRFVSVVTQRPVVEPLLPLPEQPPASRAYIFEPSPAAIMDAVLSAYISARIHRALLESRAGEHAARMAAMDAATRNAGDLIDGLARELSHARQQAITLELLDIIGGVAALEQEESV